jgi:pimeloyl-ACP methyl ester carboxylesterase
VLAENYKSRLGKIKIPTLILWGDKENIFLRPEQDLLKTGITNSVLKVYPETGHSPHWEQPEKFVKDLRNFISGK